MAGCVVLYCCLYTHCVCDRLFAAFYEHDYRATAADCASKGACRQVCGGVNELQQVKEGCSACKSAGAFGAGKYVLPILSATPLVRNGKVTEGMASLIVDASSANVQVCKHPGAQEGNPESYGDVTGYNRNTVCNASHPNNHANLPRYCGFPGLVDSGEFSPSHSTNPVHISAGLSLFCGALLPDRVYSISAHCYITNCQAESNSNSSDYVRRLLAFADANDVSIESVQGDERHVPAAGAKMFHVLGETTTSTTSDSDVIGLGSTIAIT